MKSYENPYLINVVYQLIYGNSADQSSQKRSDRILALVSARSNYLTKNQHIWINLSIGEIDKISKNLIFLSLNRKGILFFNGDALLSPKECDYDPR